MAGWNRCSKQDGKFECFLRPRLVAKAIEKQLEHLGEIKTWADTVKNNGEKISERAGKLQETLQEQVESLNHQVKALKTARTQA